MNLIHGILKFYKNLRLFSNLCDISTTTDFKTTKNFQHSTSLVSLSGIHQKHNVEMSNIHSNIYFYRYISFWWDNFSTRYTDLSNNRSWKEKTFPVKYLLLMGWVHYFVWSNCAVVCVMAHPPSHKHTHKEFFLSESSTYKFNWYSQYCKRMKS